MFKAAFVAAALLLASVSAAIVPAPPVCPTNGGRLLLSDANLGNTGQFEPNLFVYNGGGQDLMAGTPQGPWISLQQGLSCYFIPNTTLSCSFNIYSDSGRTSLIGTGQFSSNNFFTVVDSSGTVFFGGDLAVTTNIPVSPHPTGASFVNFRSGTYQLHYEAARMFPTDTSQPALLNTIAYSASDAGVITLWGGNGWNGTAFDASTRTTGLDLRFTFSCPNNPPIIVGCPPCADAGSNFVVPTACIAAEIPVRHHSSTTCVTLSFDASTSVNADNGCNDIPV